MKADISNVVLRNGRKPVVGYIYTLNRQAEAAGSPSAPSNLLWGAAELEAMGYEVRQFYPSSYLSKFSAWCRFFAYFNFLIKARRELAECDVLYVSAHNIVMSCALARFLRVIRAELIVVLGAVHIGLPRGGAWRRPWLKILDRWILQRSAVTLYLTEAEAKLARLHVGLENKTDWIRFGVDANFYTESAQKKEPCIIAIGNDANRDWHVISQTASWLRNIPFKVVTQDLRIRKQIYFPENVQIFEGLDLAKSRDLLAGASLLLMATKPNLHFSGMTTVMNALLVGTPVVLDETEALDNYLLRSGVNCVTFKRGSPTDAAQAIRELLNNLDKWKLLREEGLRLKEAYSMQAFGAALSCHIERICAGKTGHSLVLNAPARSEAYS